MAENKNQSEGYRDQTAENPDPAEQKVFPHFSKAKILTFEEVDSTNLEVMHHRNEEEGDGLVVVANRQITGLGRRGHRWYSEQSGGLYMSLLFQPPLEADDCPMLTLPAALATARAIEDITGVRPQIKWPNDLVVQGKKLCGILTTLHLQEYTPLVVIGIGINVNQDSFPSDMEHAISLLQILGKETDKESLIPRILTRLEEVMLPVFSAVSLAPCKADYEERLVSLNQKVQVLDAHRIYEAVSMGITDQGHLLVRTDSGVRKEVISGEVSVRGVYGYV